MSKGPWRRSDFHRRRFFIDFEFIEDGRTIDPISVGIVGEDGSEFYAEFADADLGRSGFWVQQNVIPFLRGPGSPSRMSRVDIARNIYAFVGNEPEFWGYYSDYDWVALCQLYGRMVDLPPGWPMFCLDLKQEAFLRGFDLSTIPKEREHHALFDARWIKKAWEAVMPQ